MGTPIELDADLADALRAEARERGFADAETYLVWIVHNRERLFDRAAVTDRLDEIEQRLAAVETALQVEDIEAQGEGGVAEFRAGLAGEDTPDEGATGEEAIGEADAKEADGSFWADDKVATVIDGALDEPSGAGDDDVAAAISDAEETGGSD